MNENGEREFTCSTDVGLLSGLVQCSEFCVWPECCQSGIIYLFHMHVLVFNYFL